MNAKVYPNKRPNFVLRAVVGVGVEGAKLFIGRPGVTVVIIGGGIEGREGIFVRDWAATDEYLRNSDLKWLSPLIHLFLSSASLAMKYYHNYLNN